MSPRYGSTSSRHDIDEEERPVLQTQSVDVPKVLQIRMADTGERGDDGVACSSCCWLPRFLSLLGLCEGGSDGREADGIWQSEPSINKQSEARLDHSDGVDSTLIAQASIDL